MSNVNIKVLVLSLKYLYIDKCECNNRATPNQNLRQSTVTRISIKAHHKQYLELIASQMGCDHATALDYALWELKRQGFSFSSFLPSTPAPLATVPPPQPIGAFTPFQEVAPAPLNNEPDEVITRFLALGMEEF